MKVLFLVFLFPAWILFIAILPAVAEKADTFLQYNKTAKTFEINEAVLSKLSRLKLPIKVVSAVGDARIGKSTTLNFVRHIWESSGNSRGAIEEVFETGDTSDTVTHGIWISILESENGSETTILLDVEGTNLGNDAVTDHLSVFTVLMSSGISVFCSETVKNHILDFLYRLPRLSELIFKGIDDINSFGRLHVVIRGALEPPSGISIEDNVKDAILSPERIDEGTDNKRKAIAKYFPRRNITVSEIPFVTERKLFRDTQRLSKSKYWDVMKSLSQEFKQFPAKKTLRGGLVDGDALTQTAKTLVRMMNNNAWMEFGDSYLMLEKAMCDRSYKDLIVPLMKLKASSRKVEAEKETVLPMFGERCALEEEVTKARDKLRDLIKTLRDAEEKEEKLDKAEKTIRDLREVMRKANSGFWNYLGWTVAGVLGAVNLLSDLRLKENVTTVAHSEYDTIGLREVTWVWNKDAERLGLNGEAHGLIAQEVEELYPWAVLRGHDGYLRVNYVMLDFLLASMDQEHKSPISMTGLAILSEIKKKKNESEKVKMQPPGDWGEWGSSRAEKRIRRFYNHAQ